MAVNKYRANVEILKKQLAELEDENDTMKYYIEDTNENGPNQIKLRELQYWLKRAKDLIKAAHKFVNDAEGNVKQKHFFGLCFNPKSLNQLSKQVDQNSKDIAELVQEARRFNIPLSYYQEKLVVSGFENFESRKGVLKEIMKALQSSSVSIIGVHGMLGVGKTMLVREVKRQAEEDKLFDVVVMATVGSNPDLQRIQDEIARGLGLVCVSNELTSQAQEASNQIKACLIEKKVLMILDDVWALGLNLEKLGIPLGAGQKQHGQEKKNKDSLSCKILLTSEDPDSLNQIGTEKNFEIEPLTEEESWKQFKKMAIDPTEGRSLPSYAEKIAKECKGSPISIATLAKTLKSQTLVEWKIALRKLQSPSQENSLRIPRGLHLAVELSYKGLKSRELQQIFLLCILMGRATTMKDLLKYVIGLGLFPGVESIEEARDKALTLVSKLRDSCLLLDGGGSVQFDMHDLVRNVVISIASQDHGLLPSRDKDALIDWQDNKVIMGKLKWIYLSNFNASGLQLPGELKCPQLTLFHLSNKDLSPAIPPNLFIETEGLKVLGLIKLHFLSFPSSISLPINLHTLRLDQSELGSIDLGSILGKLNNLQVLSLAGCDIQELPMEVRRLIRLKFLDLSDCTKLKVIPLGVLSSLSRLEELYLGNSFIQWNYSEDQQNQRTASLGELAQLKNLTTLEVSVCDIQMFKQVLLFTELKRFKIFIGDVWNYWDSSFENSKVLKLNLDARIHFDYSVRELLKRTDYLEVLKSVKDMVNELDDDDFQQLKYRHVQNFPEVQYLFIDSKEGIGGKIFTSLEVFVLQHSMRLEKIFHAHFIQTSFEKLRIIYVEHCNQLKNLFSFSIAKQLLHLQEITVANCCNIVEIVDDKGQGSTNDIIEGIDVIELPQLQCLRLQHLPELISFSHEDDTSSRFTSLFNKKVAFPNLKRVTISHLENSTKLWQELSKNSFCNLKSLEVTYCENLTAIFPSNNEMLKELLKSLEQLEIIGCGSLNAIEILSSIRILMLDSLDNLRHIFSQGSSNVLQTLKVWRCDSLTCLSTSELWSFKYLTTLNVNGCHHVKKLVSAKAAQSLDRLVYMSVRECKNLTEIIGSDDLEREHSIIHFSKLKLLKLECLPRLGSFYSKNFMLEFQSLEKVVVGQCPKLKIFSKGVVKTPMLQRVESTKGEDKRYWCGDLNATIQRMYTEKVGFVGLKDLLLQDFPELVEIWHIRSPQEILDFTRLECLDFCEFNSFKSLLTPSMVFCLVQLQSIIVKRCRMLEQVIMGDGEESKMIIPQLCLIRLESCSDLTTFYAGSYSLEIPALTKIIVNDCPKMVTFTVSTSSEEASQYFFSSKVASPRLQHLTIESMGSLNKIWDNQLDADSWCLLNSVIVKACERLLNMFPFSMLGRLQKLEKLEIHNCNSLEEIFEYQELGTSQSQAQITTQPTLEETTTKFVFPKLTQLVLFKLPKLSCFYRHMHTTEWPSLKKLEVYGCHQLQIFASKFQSLQGTNGNNRLEIGTEFPLFWVGKVVFPNLIRLTISHLEVFVLYNSIKLEKILHGHFVQTSFLKLRSINVEHCNKLKNLFSFSIAKQLLHLQEITVSDCSNIVEIINDEGQGSTNDITEGTDVLELAQLQCLRLQNLPQCISFSHTDDTSPRFTSVFNKQVVFPNLKRLTISHMEVFALHNSIKLEKIFYGQFVQTPFFKLGILKVEHCNQLKNLFSFSIAKHLLHLQEITVSDCNNIVEIVNDEGQGSTNDITEGSDVLELAKLQCLRLQKLPKFISFSYEDGTSSTFKSVLNKKVTFPNLERMTISHLEAVVLYNSINSEKILHDQFAQISFLKLRIINVEHCNQLKDLFSFSIAKQLLHLQEITVADCSNIVEIVNDEGQGSTNDIQENDVLELAQLQCLRLQNLPNFISFTHEDDTSSRSTSLFNKQVVFPNLKMMTISHFEKSVKIWQELSENSFVNLKSLRVAYCQNLSTIFPSDNDMLRKLLKSLEKLEIIGCTSVNQIEILSSIRILMLDSLDNLRLILGQDSSVLQTPEVRQCDGLTSLSKSKLASFMNLTTLNVQGCHCMTTLVSFEAAQSLGQLVHMTVRECKSLTKIVGSDSVGREDLTRSVSMNVSYLKFMSKLRFLKLQGLLRLESFYSGNFDLKFPDLNKVVVDQCPKLKIFSGGRVSTPMLQRVELIEGEDKWYWSGNLNDTIQRMCTEKVGFVGLKDLILQDFPELMKIWHIRSPQEILDFSRLECLELYDCNNFRYLLTASIVLCLVQLQSIVVKGCVMLEQVIMEDGEGSKMIIPQLRLIRLESCSNLKTFYAGSYSLEIPALANIIVNRCQKMLTFTASTSSKEVSQYFFNSKVAFPRLQQLRIESMASLNKIWDDQHDADSWCQLDTVKVDACERLLNIFPFSMLERLQKLEKLKICNCDLLEEIFNYQLGTSQSHAQITIGPTLVETVTKFAFPKLTHLNLYKLPKLNCLCHLTHTTEWPSLKKLEVYGCGLQIFASEFLSFQGTTRINQLEIMTQCPLFWVSEATFPNLKELKLEENKSMKEIWRGQNPEYYFRKLKVLELENLYEQSLAAIPPLFIQSLPDLEKLVVKNTLFNEIFPSQRLGIEVDAPPLLTELRLFGNLQTLEVFQCHRLKNLVRYSTTKNLVQLRTMSISNCNMIEEIVVCDGDGVKDDIIFTKLKHLHLKDLPSLKSFCSGNCNFQFLSLEDVIVPNCPKLGIFTEGKVITTKLQKVKFGENNERQLWKGDLNASIQQIERFSNPGFIRFRPLPPAPIPSREGQISANS